MTTLGLAVILWVVPSIGTQGMGTIGQRYSHVDGGLIAEVQSVGQRDALRRADAAVEVALAH